MNLKPLPTPLQQEEEKQLSLLLPYPEPLGEGSNIPPFPKASWMLGEKGGVEGGVLLFY